MLPFIFFSSLSLCCVQQAVKMAFRHFLKIRFHFLVRETRWRSVTAVNKFTQHKSFTWLFPFASLHGCACTICFLLYIFFSKKMLLAKHFSNCLCWTLVNILLILKQRMHCNVCVIYVLQMFQYRSVPQDLASHNFTGLRPVTDG